jgi:hypothetical protein
MLLKDEVEKRESGKGAGKEEKVEKELDTKEQEF